MAHSIYIYYRVSAETATELRKRVSSLQALIASKTGIEGRLLTKADEPFLWMEVYEGIHDRAQFESILKRLIDESHVSELCDKDARKTEVFLYPD